MSVASKMNTTRAVRRASVIGMITAACVSTNYLLIGVTNVKFMDLMVFVSGIVFGPFVGASIGVLTWMVYGTLNPFGFSLPILIATCIGESLYGIVGGVLGDRRDRDEDEKSINSHWFINVKFAVFGFLITFVYDLFTNILSGVVTGVPVAVALLSGIPFAIAHEISNTVFFFIGASPLVRGIGRLMSGGSI